MSKKRKKLDPKQRSFDFRFQERIESHLREKSEILEAIDQAKPVKTIESFEEACIELAAAVKKAIREWGRSREELVDQINQYFGWPNESRKALSIHMLNHHLSKPARYPIPGALLYAIQHITGSLEPCRSLADASGGEVITQSERRELNLGKLESTIYEMQRLKREMRSNSRRK